jgi:hypothetical protein
MRCKARRSKPRSARRIGVVPRALTAGMAGILVRRKPAANGLVLNGRKQLKSALALDYRGPSRNKPSNTARGTPWDWADLRLASPKLEKSEGGQFGLRQASIPRGVEARGSVWTLSVPRALGSFESGRPVAPKPARAKADGKLDDGVPRAAKNRGGGALAV